MAAPAIAAEDIFRAVGPTEQRVAWVDGVRTIYRVAAGEGPPVLFVHGNPGSSEDWLPFMDLLERPSVALDLPGWGESEAPRRLDYSMHGLARFVDAFRRAVGLEEHSLCVHDWGSLALIGAQRRPDLVRRLVLIDAVPLLPGYRWHWIARWFWRRRVVGELANATTTKTSLRLLSHQATSAHGPVPEELIESTWRHWPRGFRRPILDLYRSGDPDRLAAAGERLDAIAAPALVVWGADDPYLPLSFGVAYAERLPAAELVELDRTGHWPWIERPEIVDRVVDFLEA